MYIPSLYKLNTQRTFCSWVMSLALSMNLRYHSEI